MSKQDYNVVAGGEVKADVYCGDSCDQHEPYIEAWCEGDLGSERMTALSFDSGRWPVGTKIQVLVPQCPGEDCHVDAEQQDESGKCTECGFDWKEWAERQYS